MLLVTRRTSSPRSTFVMSNSTTSTRTGAGEQYALSGVGAATELFNLRRVNRDAALVVPHLRPGEITGRAVGSGKCSVLGRQHQRPGLARRELRYRALQRSADVFEGARAGAATGVSLPEVRRDAGAKPRKQAIGSPVHMRSRSRCTSRLLL